MSLGYIQKRSAEITDESVDATFRMKKLAIQTVDVGTHQLDKLDKQEQRLDELNTSLDRIDSGMTGAENEITEMEKCCGLCLCPWNRKKIKTFKQYKQENAGHIDNLKSSAPVSDIKKPKHKIGLFSYFRKHVEEPIKDEPISIKSTYINHITHDINEDIMEENLKIIDELTKTMHEQALAIGDSIDRQNDKIHDLQTRVSYDRGRVNHANERIVNLMISV